jgi:hypothetical protein
MLGAQKQPSLKDFLTDTKTRIGLVPNHEEKKHEPDHDRCKKNSNKILLQK